MEITQNLELIKKRFICFCGSIEQAEILGKDNCIHSKKEVKSIIHKFQSKEINSLLFAGIILGISFFSHIQGVLLLPSYIFLCFLNSQKKEKTFLTLIPILFLGLLYIYPIINQESIKNVLSSSSQS